MFFTQEAVALARFLKGVTLSVSAAIPTDEHAAQLVFKFGLVQAICTICNILELMIFHFYHVFRMRAALFVNLVEMRNAVSKKSNPGICLTESNIARLQRATYLFHSAHSCGLALSFSKRTCGGMCACVMHCMYTCNMKMLDVQLRRACHACTLIVEAIVENTTKIPQDTWTSTIAACFTSLNSQTSFSRGLIILPMSRHHIWTRYCSVVTSMRTQ